MASLLLKSEKIAKNRKIAGGWEDVQREFPHSDQPLAEFAAVGIAKEQDAI